MKLTTAIEPFDYDNLPMKKSVRGRSKSPSKNRIAALHRQNRVLKERLAEMNTNLSELLEKLVANNKPTKHGLTRKSLSVSIKPLIGET